MDSDKRTRVNLTVGQILLGVALVCVWLAQCVLLHHGNSAMPTTGSKVLGAVNFMIFCAAMGLRKHGNIVLSLALLAAILATCLTAIFSAWSK